MGRLSAAGGEANAGRFLETTATEPDPTRSLTLYVARRAFALSSFIRLGLDVASCPESVQKVSVPRQAQKTKNGDSMRDGASKDGFHKGGIPSETQRTRVPAKRHQCFTGF